MPFLLTSGSDIFEIGSFRHLEKKREEREGERESPLTIPSAMRNFCDDISPDTLVSINASMISPALVFSFAKSCYIRLELLSIKSIRMGARVNEGKCDKRDERRVRYPFGFSFDMRTKKESNTF